MHTVRLVQGATYKLDCFSEGAGRGSLFSQKRAAPARTAWAFQPLFW